MTALPLPHGPSRERPPALSLLIGVRVVFGVALLAAPGRVLALVPHATVDSGACRFARILGARHLIEAAVLVRRHSRGWILAGAVVDATHAATTAVLAALDRPRRNLALANTTTASILAASGLAVAGGDHAGSRARSTAVSRHRAGRPAMCRPVGSSR